MSKELTVFDPASTLEGFSPKDVKIPFIVLLQSLSPQAKPKDGMYVQGAKEGDFMHSITQELFSSFHIYPVTVRKRFQEVTPGKTSKLVRELTLEEGLKLASTLKKDEKGKRIFPSGNVLQEKWLFWCLVQAGEGIFRAGIQLKGTQLKHGRTLLSLLQNDWGQKKTFWFHVTSGQDSHEGNTWASWNFKYLRNAEGFKTLLTTEEQKLINPFREDIASMVYTVEDPDQEEPIADSNII